MEGQKNNSGIFNRIVGTTLILLGLISFSMAGNFWSGAAFFGVLAVFFGILRLVARRESAKDKKLERIAQNLDSWPKIIIFAAVMALVILLRLYLHRVLMER